MTANAIKGDWERCLEAGMTEYVSKPIHPVLLAEAMVRALDLAAVFPAGDDAAREWNETPFPAEPVLDLAYFESMHSLATGANAGFVDQLAVMFSDSTPPRLAAMRAALDASDFDTLSREAHGLKGAAESLGLIRLATVCAWPAEKRRF